MVKIIKHLGRRYATSKSTTKMPFVLVECPKCKKQFESNFYNVRNGKVTQCVDCGHITHGKSKTRLYRIWAGMKARCYNENDTAYTWYGAKGVKVCKKWKNDFPKFEKWALKNGYTDKLTIDRIDSRENYRPKNCQWLTQSENSKKSIKNPKRVVSIDDASEICEAYATGLFTMLEISKFFPITRRGVGRIIERSQI